jgi:hypothetical protein
MHEMSAEILGSFCQAQLLATGSVAAAAIPSCHTQERTICVFSVPHGSWNAFFNEKMFVSYSICM